MNTTLVSSAMIATAILLGALIYAYSSFHTALGIAPGGLAATVATSSNPAVTTTASLLFATSTTCAARVVSTQGDAIHLYFSDRIGQRPTNATGHLQLASTTAVYDGGLYGCNAVYVHSNSAQSLTVTETR